MKLQRALSILLAVACLDGFLILWNGSYRPFFLPFQSNHLWTSVFFIALFTLAKLYLRSDAGAGQRRGRFIFLIALVGFLGNFRWMGSQDTLGSSYLPFTLLREGTFHLDTYREHLLGSSLEVNGHLVSTSPVGPAILALPVYALPALRNVPVTDRLVHNLEKTSASLIAAFSVLVMYLALSLLVREKLAFWLALLYAFGTNTVNTASQALWQHGPSQLLVALGFYAMLRGRSEEKWVKFAGLFFAAAVCCRYTDVVLVAPAVGYLYVINPREALKASLLGLPLAGLLMLYNATHYGGPLMTGYGTLLHAFEVPLWGEGLRGILLSPGRGLFVYSPFVIFSFAGLFRGVKTRQYWVVPLGLGVLFLTALFAQWNSWSAGWCYGPRFFSDAFPALILLLAPLEQKLADDVWLRRTMIGLSAWSVLLCMTGAYLYPWNVTGVSDVIWGWNAFPLWYLWTKAAAAIRLS